MSMIRDPDQRRKEQWEKAAQAQAGWAWGKWVGLGGIGAPALSVPEQNSLHARFLARSNALNLMEVAEMKILYALTYNLWKGPFEMVFDFFLAQYSTELQLPLYLSTFFCACAYNCAS